MGDLFVPAPTGTGTGTGAGTGASFRPLHRPSYAEWCTTHKLRECHRRACATIASTPLSPTADRRAAHTLPGDSPVTGCPTVSFCTSTLTRTFDALHATQTLSLSHVTLLARLYIIGVQSHMQDHRVFPNKVVQPRP